MIFTTSRAKSFKIEPYELCPCDSGAKFKFCCYAKAKQFEPKKLIDLSYSDRRINHITSKMWEETNFETCFGFKKDECVNPIKNAHSIQNNRILNRISKESHLYSIKPKATREGVVPTLELISKNKASAFFGFCDFHDTDLFKPIELQEYNGEQIQNFLFAFRAMAIEYHKKLRKLSSIKKMFTIQPHTLLDEEYIYVYRVAQLDVRDFELDYKTFKSEYCNNNFTNFRTIYRTLDFEVDFATSSAFTVEKDLNGEQINDIYGIGSGKMPSIYINVYPTVNGTNILLSYHLNEDPVYKKYFDQLELLSEGQLMKYLNYLIIQYTENVFFNPSFIDNLTTKQQASLLKSFHSSIQPLEAMDLISENNYFKFNLFTNNAD
ncbi:SEC-C domain-containing protein [Paenibacillus sp. SN-8-1]|uniref:SEC-C domain-containing protein n=1 Tax=Paenibacillus sp. SN-8-1 TaxID=3435409 RepID=UPI003D9A228A